MTPNMLSIKLKFFNPHILIQMTGKAKFFMEYLALHAYLLITPLRLKNSISETLYNTLIVVFWDESI